MTLASKFQPLAGALVGCDYQRQAPVALPLGKRPHALLTEGWVGPSHYQKWCGTSRPPLELDPQVIQPIAGRYRDALAIGDDF
jgi:hypothetical protein